MSRRQLAPSNPRDAEAPRMEVERRAPQRLVNTLLAIIGRVDVHGRLLGGEVTYEEPLTADGVAKVTGFIERYGRGQFSVLVTAPTPTSVRFKLTPLQRVALDRSERPLELRGVKR